MRISLLVIALLIRFGAAPQNQPTPATSTPTSGSSDLDNCKSGQGNACISYGQALGITCHGGGTDLQQLQCMRKASCYQNRGMQLNSSNPNPFSTDSCDAKLTVGSGDNISGLYIPDLTWHWPPDVHAGDCTQTEGTLTLKADGTITWDAVVMTSHTVFADIWHARFELQDKDGVPLGNLIDFDSPKMGVPGVKAHWNSTGTFDKSLFPKVVHLVEHSSC